MIDEGVTTVEIKSGYGLDTANELKQLRVARALGAALDVDVRTTLLAAHALPPEFADRADAYIDYVCDDTIPAAAREGTRRRRRRVLRDDRLHAGADAPRVRGGARAPACRSSCTPTSFRTATARASPPISARCRPTISNTRTKRASPRWRAAGTVAVLLPGAFYALRETRLPPIDALRAHRVPIAISTDCNPGTSPATSLPLMMNMACTLFRLTPREALAGVTQQRGARARTRRPRHARRRAARRHRVVEHRRARRARIPDRRQALRRGHPRRPLRAEPRLTCCSGNLARGDSPLIVNVPHAGRHVPDAIAVRMSARAREVPDTDWHVDALYRFAPATGATLMTATHSRYVVDLNRDPSGAALYPGADNTELCPTRTFCNEPVYRPGEEPSDARDRRAARDVLRSVSRAARARDRARARTPRLRGAPRRSFDRRRGAALFRRTVARPQSRHQRRRGAATRRRRRSPRASCRTRRASRTSSTAASRAATSRAATARPHASVHALQLEMTQACYMDEAQSDAVRRCARGGADRRARAAA